MKITCRELTPARWKDLEKLFGDNGACGGCWCMYWRQPRGEDWEKVKGAENKKRFRRLVREGKAHGVIAYEGKTPVGWVSFDRRRDFEKLDRAPSFKCADAEEVWAIPCFYIPSKFRNQGIATALLDAAVNAVKKHGGTLAEAYPVKLKSKDNPLPAAFAWTGIPSMFRKKGFRPVGSRNMGKQRMRKTIR